METIKIDHGPLDVTTEQAASEIYKRWIERKERPDAFPFYMRLPRNKLVAVRQRLYRMGIRGVGMSLDPDEDKGAWFRLVGRKEVKRKRDRSRVRGKG